MASGIDPEIGQLVTLAQAGTAASRSELYLSIADLMQRRGAALSASERGLVTSIMRQLSRQVEMEVRHALAERIATMDDAPHDLVLMLANDRIEVARSILENSLTLSENELIDVINETSYQHQNAIAARPDVTPRIAASLSESSVTEVLVTLVRNQRARITTETMERLAERSRDSVELQQGILCRPDVAADLAHRMCAFVSDALHAFITQRFDIDPAAVKKSLAIASAEAHARMTNASGSERLVAKLHAAGQLKPGFAIKALNHGQLDVFEHAVATMVGAPVEVVIRMLKSGDASLFALLCQAIGIDRSAFSTLFTQAETLRGRSGILSQQDRSKADAVFNSISRDDARQTVLRRAA